MVLTDTLAMPSVCSVLAEEEMVYLDGGGFLDIFNPSLWDINLLAENLVLAIGSFSASAAISWGFSQLMEGKLGEGLGNFFFGSAATVGVFTSAPMFIAFTACSLCVGYLLLWQVDQVIKASQLQQATQNPLKS